MKQKLTSQKPARQMTEEEIEEEYSDDEFERNDLLDSGKPADKKEKPSPSVNTSTK